MAHERNYAHSHSELEQYELCPYMAQRVRGSAIPMPALVFGQAVHSAAQWYGQACVATGEPSRIADVPAIVARVGDKYALCGEERDELEGIVTKFGSELCFPSTAEFEVKLRFDRNWQPVLDDAPAWAGGTIDMVEPLPDDDSAVTIWDYKSDRSIPAASSNRMARYERQLDRYAAMLMATRPGINAVECRNLFIRYNHRTNGFRVTRNDVARILDVFGRAIRGMVADPDPQVRPGEHCSTHCPIARFCPAWQDCPESLIVIDSVELAREYAGRVLAMEAAVRQIKDALKGYVEENGPVVLETGSWNFRASITERYDLAGVDGLLRPHGIQLLNLMEGSRSAVEKVIKDATAPRSPIRKQLLEEAKKFMSATTATRFTFKKEGGKDDDDEQS